MMQAPQPRAPPNGHTSVNDWNAPPRLPAMQPPSRPTSASYGRSSGEHAAYAYSGAANGHGPSAAQGRQQWS
jgi:hypothetical protein